MIGPYEFCAHARLLRGLDRSINRPRERALPPSPLACRIVSLKQLATPGDALLRNLPSQIVCHDFFSQVLAFAGKKLMCPS
jgi:hypothetical protein